MRTKAIVVAVLVAVFGHPATGQTPKLPPAGGIPAAAPDQKPLTKVEQKLDNALVALTQAVRSRDTASMKAWREKYAAGADARRPVAVDITGGSEKAAASIRRAVRKQGGQIVASFKNVVHARMPARGIEPIAARSDVVAVRLSLDLNGPSERRRTPKNQGGAAS